MAKESKVSLQAPKGLGNDDDEELIPSMHELIKMLNMLQEEVEEQEGLLGR